ncbi:hypothetical protein HN51_000637, partial [Arachis hypogaea]
RYKSFRCSRLAYQQLQQTLRSSKNGAIKKIQKIKLEQQKNGEKANQETGRGCVRAAHNIARRKVEDDFTAKGQITDPSTLSHHPSPSSLPKPSTSNWHSSATRRKIANQKRRQEQLLSRDRPSSDSVADSKPSADSDCRNHDDARERDKNRDRYRNRDRESGGF